MAMNIKLSDHFTYKKILKLTFTPILMMIFVALYSFCDGIIIANTVSDVAFGGINLIYPLTLIVSGVGVMFGTGGAAITGKYLGEKKNDAANNAFTNVVIASIVVGIICSIICFFTVKPLAIAMGSITKGTTQEMIDTAIVYGRILAIGQFAFVLEHLFHIYFVVAEKPLLGFVFSVLAGVTNIVFDLIFILVCNLGIKGAAIATVMGFFVGGVGPIIYFLTHKKGTIRLIKPKIEIFTILKASGNGVSEFINFTAMSVVSLVINIQLLKYFPDQSGVIAYGVIQNIVLIFVAIFLGYSNSMAPAMSYHYGAKNTAEMKNIFHKSLRIILIVAISMVVLGEAISYPIACAYFNDTALIDFTTNALRIWIIHFFFAGFVIYSSSMFTALNNGLVSGLISTFRTFVSQISCAFILPLIMGGNGIWWSASIAEFIAMVVGIILIIINQKRYEY